MFISKCKKILTLLLLVTLTFVIVLVFIKKESLTEQNDNILFLMRDGMKNELIIEICSKEIVLVKDAQKNGLTEQGIEIRYYETDLNQDGLKDIFIIIRSPLHTGSSGDTFWIKINRGEYYESGLPIMSNIELLDADLQPFQNDMSSICISDGITNGFYDIVVRSFQDVFILKYDGNGYSEVSNGSSRMITDDRCN